MTVLALQKHYDNQAKDGRWGEHPVYSYEDWRYEVMERNTRIGYWEWVLHQIEEAKWDEEFEKNLNSKGE